MYRDNDFDLQKEFPENADFFIKDLELRTIFESMSLGDNFLFDVSKKAILLSLNDIATIIYRQNILRDCIKNFSTIKELYKIAVEPIERKKRRWYGIYSHYPRQVLSGAIETILIYMDLLEKIRGIADQKSDNFDSEGFKNFFSMIKKELDDEFFKNVQTHLKTLKFRDGILMSAELDKGNEGTNYILRKPNNKNQKWVKRLFTKKSPIYSFRIADRDEGGARALSELSDRGINLVANALAQSSDHIESFFEMLRVELGFYIGCLNLYEQMVDMDSPVVFPQAFESDERVLNFYNLYDISLALTMKKKVVGNDINANNKNLVIITGANQGGKSTFIRSIGITQLMMQSGMFVPAKAFSSNISNAIFTHFKREEDANMESGKLDEELSRMNDIIGQLKANSLILFNESFSATNEREGSEIARQIISALIEKNIKVFYVTHLYEFANNFYIKKLENSIFLRAERLEDGTRTFKLVEGAPLETSYGEDLYQKILSKKRSFVH